MNEAVLWPFYRYDVLMPKHIETDVLIWLYLSLLVYENEQSGKSKDSYDEEEKKEVKRLIKEKFSEVIDDNILEKVISDTKKTKKFILEDKTSSKGGKKILSEEVFTYIDEFEELFSSDLETKHIYQDAITGEIVPVFDDMPLYDEQNSECAVLKPREGIKRPSTPKIRKAYKDYYRLSNTSTSESELPPEEFSDIIDPDAEVDWDNEQKENIFEEEKKKNPSEGKNKSEKDFIFLEKSRSLYHLKVKFDIEDSEIKITSPFDSYLGKKMSTLWINRCLQKAVSICPELDKIYKELQEKYIPKKETASAKNEIDYTITTADQLRMCGSLYRLIESIPITQALQQTIDDLKRIIIKLDEFFIGKSESYFQQIGKYLECLISPLVEPTNKNQRTINWAIFKSEIHTISVKLGINGNPLLTDAVFRNWKEAKKNYKADIADMLLHNTKCMRCPSFYKEFIEDAFALYNLRNENGHYKKNQKSQYDEKQIELLSKITRVFIDLY